MWGGLRPLHGGSGTLTWVLEEGRRGGRPGAANAGRARNANLSTQTNLDWTPQTNKLKDTKVI